jgi:hypothetical protein
MSTSLVESHPLSLNDIEVLQLASGLGQPIHNMAPAATALLAERGIFTTTEPREPGGLIEHIGELRNRRALGQIATQATTMFSAIPKYAESAYEGRLGSRLAGVFGQITAISAEDVHLEDPVEDKDGEIVDGIVTASLMGFSVPTQEAAGDLASALRGLMRSHRPEDNFTVDTFEGEDDEAHWVTITGINEHHVRSLGRTVGALLTIEDRAEGFELPSGKHPLATWQENGETFPPIYLDRLEAAEAAYHELKPQLSATYRGHDELKPSIHDHLVGTDAAAAFQGMREIMNGLIWHIRGGSHKNLEQHPLPEARLMAEDGVILKRDPVRLEDVRGGPPTSRTLKLKEQAVNKAKNWAQYFHREPYHAVLDLFSTGLNGLVDAAVYLAHLAPNTYYAWHRFQSDRQSWHDQKQAVANSHQRVHSQIAEWILGARMDISRTNHPEPYIPRPHVDER